MVFVILDPAAVEATLALAKESGSAVWLGADVMTPEDHTRHCAAGLKLTRFTYPLSGASADVIQRALETVAEHHPGEVIWVQYVPRAD